MFTHAAADAPTMNAAAPRPARGGRARLAAARAAVTTAAAAVTAVVTAVTAITAVVALAVVASPRAAHAQANTPGVQSQGASTATTYSTKRRQFNVGVLLLDSTIDANNDGVVTQPEADRGPENPDPYVFYFADARVDVKPQNWEFVNPLAPGTISNDIKARWDARMGGANRSGYQAGQRVTKDMAAYWEVSLTNTPVADLIQYDLLFITHHRTFALSPADREKLRKVVDAGGIVWIEDCGNMRFGTPGRDNRFFLSELQFNGGTAATPNLAVNSNPPGPVIYQPTHPILSTPYQLSFQEIANLGDKNYDQGYAMTRQADPSGPATLEMPDANVLVNIVANRSVGPTDGPFQPYIAAGYYGSGAVIVTSSDSGCDINDYAGGENVGSGGNSGSRSGPNLATAHAEDLKFLYNVVAWGGANNSFRRNNRRTAATFEAVRAPVLAAWDFSGQVARSTDVLNSRSAPLIVNGVVFVSGLDASGARRLNAYDSQPFRDLDGDGNFDDGVLDIGQGYNYDLIWSVLIPAGGTGGTTTVTPSAPVYGDVALAPGSPTPFLFVAVDDGTLYRVPAFPTDNLGRYIPPTPLATPPTAASGVRYDTGATHGVAPAPVFFENKIFQVLPDGQVRCVGASDGVVRWVSFTAAPFPIKPSGTPTLGFVRLTTDGGSGGSNPSSSSAPASTATAIAANSLGATNDLMLYIPAEVTPPTASAPEGRILAYWVGTRNEVQRGFRRDTLGDAGYMNTRLSGGTGSPGAFLYAAALGPPFVTPRARVFSPTRDTTTPANNRTALQNYEAGIESSDYVAVFGDGTDAIDAGLNRPNGRVRVRLRAGSGAPAPGPNGENDILIAVDYDVQYMLPSGEAPQQYGNTSQSAGARPNNNLSIAAYVPAGASPSEGNLDTAALTANDTLIFGARQNASASAPGAQPVVGLFGLHEEEGATRLRWRVTLPAAVAGFNPLAGAVSRSVVADELPIKNHVDFSADWPATNIGSPPTPLPGNQDGVTVVRTVGSPIVTNQGIAYALAEGRWLRDGRIMTVLVALRSEPTITLTLPPFVAEDGVVVSQLNALTNTGAAGTTPRPVTASANNIGDNILRLNGERGRVEILNFNAPGGQFSATQSFVVSATPLDPTAPSGRGQRTEFVVSPKPEDAFDQGVATAPGGAGTAATATVQRFRGGGFTPILWYYVLPGIPQSAPTLVGDNIYFTLRNAAGRSFLIAVDADPSANDPGVRVGFSEPVPNVVERVATGVTDTLAEINHVRMATLLPSVGGAEPDVFPAAPPVAGGGTLALNTSRGTFAFSDQTTLIAEAKRVLEVGADAAALWSLDGTQLRTTVGGDLPVFSATGALLNPPALGRVNLESRPLSHPSRARRIGNGDYLIADTGNNRVVRVDRGGFITWQFDRIADPYQILGGGEPRTLNGPTDIQFYVTPTPDAANPTGPALGYEVHYIVADPGNFRIIEVADYFDRNGQPVDAPGTDPGTTVGQRVVVWTTRTQSKQGRQLRYESVTRFQGAGTDPSDGATVFGYPYIVATVSNSRVAGGGSTATNDFTGGSLVSLNYAPYNTAIQVQTTAGGRRSLVPWRAGADATAIANNEPAANGTVLSAADDLTVYLPGGATRTKRLTRPTYFEQLSLPGATPADPVRTVYLIADTDGVYAVHATTNAAGRPERRILWAMGQAEYDRLNADLGGGGAGRIYVPAAGDGGELPRFAPASVRLLPNNRFLVTNAWSGKTSLFRGGRFTGEVVEVNPRVTLIELLNAPRPTVFLGEGALPGIDYYGGFSAPRISKGGPAAGGQPPIQNTQVMGNPGNTGLVEQPLFADRQ